MERIGVAASKIVKDNLFLYNFYVVGISFLFSLFIFIIAGASILFALIVIRYIGEEVMPFEFEKQWTMILSLCMIALTVVTVLFNLLAILKNIKLPKK